MLDFVVEPSKSAALIRHVRSRQIMDLPSGSRAYEIAVFTKEYGPVQYRVDSTVVHGTTYGACTFLVMCPDYGNIPISRRNAMILGDSDNLSCCRLDRL